jgi:hypothetical protein
MITHNDCSSKTNQPTNQPLLFVNTGLVTVTIVAFLTYNIYFNFLENFQCNPFIFTDNQYISAVIRPWNINPRQNVGVPKRCDPVKLYHHYQDIWRQQKVPGEDNHYDLRWSVRERMLSEDPHPRVSMIP